MTPPMDAEEPIRETEAGTDPAVFPPSPPGTDLPEDPSRYPYATWGPWVAVGGAIAALILGLMLALPVVWAAGNGDYDSYGWDVKAIIQFCTALGFLIMPFLFAKEFPGGTSLRQAAGRLGFHRFRPGNAAKWIGIGLVAYIAFAIVYVAIFGEPKQDDIAGELGPWWSQILLIVVLAPLTEEICFRGLLFGGFRHRFNLPVAAIGAGLVFGALHYSTGVSAVPQLMVLGAIFAVVYDRTESIWPAIIFHAINNAYVLIVLNS
jgi:membrane protease YdiL (CAAX protease family)